MEMQQEKLDEGSIIIATECACSEVERLVREYGFTITDEEIAYYMKHLKIQRVHQELILAAFASSLGSYRNAMELSRIDFIILALLLKKRLLVQHGYDDVTQFTDTIALPYILTGNVKEKINTRLIRNQNFKESCEESYVIEGLLKEQYNYLEEIDKERIMTTLSTINNTVFTYCCYEKPEILDEEILVDKVPLSDEVGFFLRSI